MLCGFSLVFAFCAAYTIGFGPTIAQQTKSSLNSEVSANLPDNTSGLITPSILRTTINDIIASFQQAPVKITRASATDTILISDFGQVIAYSASPVAVTLPQATGSFANFNVYIKAANGPVTVTPTVSTIDSATSLAVAAGGGALIVAGSGNYTAITSGTGGGGGGSGSVTNIGAGAGLVTGTGSAITSTGTLFVQTMNPGGRITLTSGTPVTSTDVTGANSIFYAPYVTPYVPIYNGTVMRLYQFTSSVTDIVGLTISLGSNWTANSNYDGFIGVDTGVVRFCTGPAWSSNASRGAGAGTTEVQFYNGVWTNANSMTCRYSNASTFTCAVNQCTLVGSVRLDGSKQAVDSVAFRWVSNAYNTTPRAMVVNETTDNWPYTGGAYRQMNGNSANQLDFLQSLDGGMVAATVTGQAINTNVGVLVAVGIGVGVCTVNNASVWNAGGIPVANSLFALSGSYYGFPGIGRRTLCAEEYSAATGTTTWFGDAGQPGVLTAGISGWVLN